MAQTNHRLSSLKSNDAHRVVKNVAGQYSTLSVQVDLPPGWQEVGFTGAKSACLDYIEECWTVAPSDIDKLNISVDEQHSDITTFADPDELMFPIQRFEAVVDKDPDRIAVVDGNRLVSYGVLEAKSNRLANYLIETGIRPGSIVCTHLMPDFDMIVALLGISKSGGAYLTIDPNLPDARKELIIKDVDPSLIIDANTLADRLKTTCQVIDLVKDEDLLNAQHPGRPTPRAIEGSLACLFYTSGSTGEPKAVMMPWRRSPSPEKKSPFPSGADRHVLKSSPAFTLVAREVYQPLVTGGRIYIMPAGRHQDPNTLLDLVIAERITLLSVVPSLLRIMIESPRLTQCHSLRHIDCIGEALLPELRVAFQNFLRVPLSVTYGCTEAPSVSARKFDPGERCEDINLGRPSDGRDVHILDQNLDPVPPGHSGRIYLGGMLSIGYYNSPRLTAERFLPDPFSEVPGARLYDSGDRGKLNADGSLIYLGRTDNQIQINGQRVDCTEVEKTIAAMDSVEQVVAVLQGQSDEPMFVAYVVTGNESLMEAEVREHARSHLPHYMVPARFKMLRELPLLPSGKLDRAALPEIEPTHSDSALRREPRSSTEQSLVEIWSEVFEIQEVGFDDNFFSLGGQSIHAIRIASRVREQFNVDLSLMCFFDLPTIAELAEAIEGTDQKSQKKAQKN